jgi:FkbM family methyltransferase
MVKFLVKSLLNFFDNISKKKVLSLLNNIFNDKINYIIDVGSHHGETIIFLNNNFKYNKIFAFEPSSYNYKVLKKKINFINNNNIFLINKGIGIKNEKKILTQLTDSSSCTYCLVKQDSKYFINKKKIFNFKDVNTTEETQTISLKAFMIANKLKYVNYLKTDTEGFELNVLKSLENFINKVKLIHFEHHYDDMYIKNYKFSDIHRYLLSNNFIQVYKFKMYFRKSFEYFYLNNSLLIND